MPGRDVHIFGTGNLAHDRRAGPRQTGRWQLCPFAPVSPHAADAPPPRRPPPHFRAQRRVAAAASAARPSASPSAPPPPPPTLCASVSSSCTPLHISVRPRVACVDAVAAALASRTAAASAGCARAPVRLRSPIAEGGSAGSASTVSKAAMTTSGAARRRRRAGRRTSSFCPRFGHRFCFCSLPRDGWIRRDRRRRRRRRRRDA